MEDRGRTELSSGQATGPGLGAGGQRRLQARHLMVWQRERSGWVLRVKPAPGKGEDRQGAAERGADRGQGTATVEALSGQGSGGPVGPVNTREEVQRQVEGCMWHESDLAVRSVVLNVTIEQLPAPTFDARHVPSNPDSPRNPYTAEDLIHMSTEEQVKLFGNLAARLRRPAPSDEHVNCIRYIQSLGHSKGASQRPHREPLMTSIVRCLSSARTPARGTASSSAPPWASWCARQPRSRMSWQGRGSWRC